MAKAEELASRLRKLTYNGRYTASMFDVAAWVEDGTLAEAIGEQLGILTEVESPQADAGGEGETCGTCDGSGYVPDYDGYVGSPDVRCPECRDRETPPPPDTEALAEEMDGSPEDHDDVVREVRQGTLRTWARRVRSSIALETARAEAEARIADLEKWVAFARKAFRNIAEHVDKYYDA